VAAALWPAAVAAQAPSLALDEAIARALAHDPGVRAARAARDEAAARTGQARAGYLPRVDLTESWQRSNQPVFVFSSLLSQRRFTQADFALETLNRPDALSNHRIAVTLDQPVFDGWRTAAAVRTGTLEAQIAELALERAIAGVRLAVVRAYGRVLVTTAAVASATAFVESAASDLERARARRDNGLETEASVLALQVSLDQGAARRSAAQADAALARAELNALVGAGLDDAPSLAAFGERAPVTIDAASLERRALEHRAEVRQAAARVDQAHAARRAARASLLPHLGVQAGFEANGSAFDDRATSWIAGVQVRWNLFAGGGDAAASRAAAFAATRAAAERERVETAVRLDVRSAVAQVQSAAAREQASRQGITQARESQRIIRDRYEAGLAPASELLRAAGLLRQAEADRIAATVDLHVAIAALEYASGVAGLFQ
jgi:outer membrane protein TolC